MEKSKMLKLSQSDQGCERSEHVTRGLKHVQGQLQNHFMHGEFSINFNRT